MKRLLTVVFAASIAAPALADPDHLQWRQLAITSQAEQIVEAGRPFYVITGTTAESEAAYLVPVCGLVGLNAAVQGASEDEINFILDKVSAIKTPEAVVSVSLLKEIPEKVKGALGCK